MKDCWRSSLRRQKLKFEDMKNRFHVAEKENVSMRDSEVATLFNALGKICIIKIKY